MSAVLLMSLVLFLATAGMAVVIGSWRSALLNGPDADVRPGDDPPRVSVVVPARDEEACIAHLLQDLYAQRYPKELLEVIVVDDGSSDRTTTIAHGMRMRWPQLVVLANQGQGKKAAITTGVQAAHGELIVVSDADGRCGPERIPVLATRWALERSAMLVAPVWTEGAGLVARLQSMEQAALLGAAIGSASHGSPFLAYGANLAFTREAFFRVGGYEGDRFASGDDVFLLRRMRRAGLRVSVVKEASAMVTVEAERTWAGFVRQRLRWAGKMRGAGGATVMGALVVLVLPWLLLGATIRFDFVGSMGSHALYTALLLGAAWLCWFLPILGLVRDTHRMMQKPFSALSAWMALLAFSTYAPAIAVLSVVLRPKWKGRRV